MTLDADIGRETPRRKKIGRRKRNTLIVLAVLAVFCVGYVARYGLCESRSKFCVLDIAGTRSEVGVEWDSWSVYVSTYPAG